MSQAHWVYALPSQSAYATTPAQCEGHAAAGISSADLPSQTGQGKALPSSKEVRPPSTMTGLSASKVPASSEYALGSSQAHSLKEVPLHSANASPLHLGHSPSGIGTAVKPEQYPSAFPPSR